MIRRPSTPPPEPERCREAPLPARGPRRWPLVLVAGLLLGSTGVPAVADVIVLRNGNEIQGEVIRETPDRLVVRFPGGVLELRRRQVLAVRRQSRADYLLDEGAKAGLRSDHDAAVDALEEAVVEAPESLRARQALRDARLARANALQDLRRHEEALAAYRGIVEDYPDCREAREEIDLVVEARQEAMRELELARRELTRGDLETSIWRLKKVHEEYPDLRPTSSRDLAQASVERGKRLFRAAQWEEAAGLFLQALTLCPDLIEAVRSAYLTCQLRRLEPLVRRGEFGPVEPLAREGLSVDPSDERLLFLLGMSLEARGAVREAGELYAEVLGEAVPSGLERRIVDLRKRAEAEALGSSSGRDPLHDPQSRRVLTGGFRSLRAAHFVVRHRNTAVGRHVARVAEGHYRGLFRRLGCNTHWRTPCEIIVHPTKAAYLAEGGTQEWSVGHHRLLKRQGAFSEHRIVTYQDQPGLTAGVLQHEIAHALLAHRLNYPDEIPLWANEGFAIVEGGGYVRRHYRQLLQDAARRRTLIPLRELLTLRDYPSADRVGLYYAESWSLVEWLLGRERGLGTFVRLLRSVTSGQASLVDALRAHYRVASLAALETRWHGSL